MMGWYAFFRVRALVCAVAAVLVATVGCSQTLTWLGIPNSSFNAALDVSADGRVAVGWAYFDATGLISAIRWENNRFQILGTLGGNWSEALDVSANGNVVVGMSYNASGQQRAFRWTAEGGMQDLGTLGGTESEAWGVSADGTVIVGWARNASGQQRAFRWTAEGGMQDLGTLGGSESFARTVAANRAVVIGYTFDSADTYRAFRWENGVMQDLGTLGGDSAALGVCADGTVVVGWSFTASGMRAFRWTPTGGMEDINLTYASLLTDDSLLTGAYALSPSGRHIVGQGFNADRANLEAYLLDTGLPIGDVNRDGCVNDDDLLAVLLDFGREGYRNEDINWDGTVNDTDLLTVVFYIGSGCE